MPDVDAAAAPGSTAHRRLREVPALGAGDPAAAAAGNLLVQGDNREALPLLLPRLAGAVRCVYLDPPYNNRERYTHYDDRADHARWLEDMRATIGRLLPFLAEDGSLWISIDDRAMHYLKVAADEVLGRGRFVTTIVWQQRTTRENRRAFSNNHEYLLVYARDPRAFRRRRGLLPWDDAARRSRFANPDGDPRGPWQSVSANVQAGHGTARQFYELAAPPGEGGRRHRPPKGRCWIYDEARMRAEIAAGRVWFGRDGAGVPRLKHYLAEAREGGLTPHTLWLAGEVGTSDSAKKHLLRLFPHQPVFDTPKPEALLHRVLTVATAPGDLVLDPFLGSGTTAAVAQKTGRRWVGVESGAQAVTHCAERLRRVVEGEAGGISRAVGWRGGGGFRFARVG